MASPLPWHVAACASRIVSWLSAGRVLVAVAWALHKNEREGGRGRLCGVSTSVFRSNSTREQLTINLVYFPALRCLHHEKRSSTMSVARLNHTSGLPPIDTQDLVHIHFGRDDVAVDINRTVFNYCSYCRYSTAVPVLYLGS